jgi:hypothetical protein
MAIHAGVEQNILPLCPVAWADGRIDLRRAEIAGRRGPRRAGVASLTCEWPCRAKDFPARSSFLFLSDRTGTRACARALPSPATPEHDVRARTRGVNRETRPAWLGWRISAPLLNYLD